MLKPRTAPPTASSAQAEEGDASKRDAPRRTGISTGNSSTSTPTRRRITHRRQSSSPDTDAEAEDEKEEESSPERVFSPRRHAAPSSAGARSRPARPATRPKKSSSGRKETDAGDGPSATESLAHFFSGILAPLRVLLSLLWTMRPLLLYGAGTVLSVVLLYALGVSLLARLRLPSFLWPRLSSLLPEPVSAALGQLDLCAAPLAAGLLPHCAAQKRRRAESTELAARFTSGLVELVATTPQAQYVQLVSNSAHSLAQAFRLRSTVESAGSIARDLEAIGEETERMVDSVIEVEVQGRVAVADMVAGNQELLNMLGAGLDSSSSSKAGAGAGAVARYSADLVERRLNRLIENTDAALESLQLELVRAQQSASRVVALQHALRGKLLAEQNEWEERDVRDREARSLLGLLRRSVVSALGGGGQADEGEEGAGAAGPAGAGAGDASLLSSSSSNKAKPLTPLESHRLHKNLNLLNLAIEDAHDWSHRFSEFSLYLRSYRSQVSARKRQLEAQSWTGDGMGVEERVRAIGRVLEPARERLAEIERRAEGPPGGGPASTGGKREEPRLGLEAGSGGSVKTS